LTALELILRRIEDLAIDDDEFDGSDRSLSEPDPTAETRVSESVVTL
jgi:hypothetical protein